MSDLQVSRENVLEVRSVLLGEADRLLDSIRSASSRRGWVGPCGGDPVSAEASAAFDARIRLVLEQCQRYALELKRAGDALDQVARGYGYTDAQLAASLTSRDPGSAG
ncbi:MAG TPA: PE domain-containing protein [Pseudonocardia sp.]|nr:PE domain-containing protein [Pseudonocardia sp.]